MGELGNEYLGYYKVCCAPERYLEATALLKDCCETVSLTAEAALVRAEHMAKLRISAMPALAELQARRNRHHEAGDSSLPAD
jgi:hypothetical protein